MNDAGRILQRAKEVAETVESWADLSNALYNPIDGIVTSAYRTRAERAAFIKTDEYKQIRELIHAAMDKFGLVEGATPVKSGRFVVRVPRSMHAALEQEARRERVSLNQLVVAKLAVPLSSLAQKRVGKSKKGRVAS